MNYQLKTREKNLAQFADYERRTQYEPLRTYDWQARYLAREHGQIIPKLVGDDMFIHRNFPYQMVNVIDGFGNWAGTTFINFEGLEHA